MQTSFPRYLARLAAVLAGVLLVAWLYVLALPMAFLEGGYPAWVAKSAMLRDCQLGRIAFFGDSRLEAGVIPALLPVPASNLGLAAGTAIETNSAVRRALACAEPPQQVVLSLSPEHFGPLDRFFWINDLRYGFISPGELLAAERQAAALGDTASFGTARTPDGFTGPLRDWMYALRFPSLFFGNMVQGRLFGRYASNQARLQAVLQARGFSEYRRGDPERLDEADGAGFVTAALQLAQFEQALAALQARGVPVWLLAMPSRQEPAPDAVQEAAYLDYLRALLRRFTNVRLLGRDVPHWPATLFADARHLSGAGARAFTTRLAACITDGRLEPGCDLDWRPAGTAARE